MQIKIKYPSLIYQQAKLSQKSQIILNQKKQQTKFVLIKPISPQISGQHKVYF